MRVPFLLMGGESAEVFDIGSEPMKDKVFVYRFCVERFAGCELKIVRDRQPARMIPADSRTRVVDVAVSSSLFVEAVGKGAVSGWYELVGAR